MVSLPAAVLELKCSARYNKNVVRSKKTFQSKGAAITESIREDLEREEQEERELSSGRLSRSDSRCRRFRFQRRKSSNLVTDSDSGDSGPEFLAAELMHHTTTTTSTTSLSAYDDDRGSAASVHQVKIVPIRAIGIIIHDIPPSKSRVVCALPTPKGGICCIVM